MTDEPRPAIPAPEDCARAADHPGAAVVMADGREWTIPHALTAERLDPIRDRMFDDMVATGTVSVADARTAAFMLLLSAYRLEPSQAAALVAVDADATTSLVEAVCQSLIDGRPHVATYSRWARSALLSNGIDPAKLRQADAGDVLAHLVATGRAQPFESFVSSAAHERRRADLLALRS